MRSINKVILVGNLTRDPEMRQTPNGQSVATFGMATNRDWMTKEGDRKNSAEFHECVAWAGLAEICAKYIKKGNLIYVEGYLKTRSWDSPEGVKKFKTEIVVKDMIRLEKRAKDDEGEYYLPEEVSEIVGPEIEAEMDLAAPVEKAIEAADSAQIETPDTPTEIENTNENDGKEKVNAIDKDLGL